MVVILLVIALVVALLAVASAAASRRISRVAEPEPRRDGFLPARAPRARGHHF